MSGRLPYNEYKPVVRSVTGRFPQADEPVNPAVVSSRRPHIRAYITYMAPPLASQHDRWWNESSEFVAASYEKQGLKEVPAETFDFQVDKRAFQVFCGYNSDLDYNQY
jgi:hypothetical protein